MLDRTATKGKKIWFHDHGGSVHCGAIVDFTSTDVVLRTGSRVVTKSRDDCFEDEATAIAFQMKLLTRKITAFQDQWTNLALQLVRCQAKSRNPENN